MLKKFEEQMSVNDTFLKFEHRCLPRMVALDR